MCNETYKYSLETITDHIAVINKRFSEIHSSNDFIATDYGKMLLDSIVTRLQAIGENVKIYQEIITHYKIITLKLSGI